MNFKNYSPENFFDEMFEEAGKPRPEALLLVEKINRLSNGQLKNKQQAAEIALMNLGITFTVYGDESGHEKILPFDIIPRIIGNKEWLYLKEGLEQRIVALNMFIRDIYNKQQIVREGIIPEDIILSSPAYRKECAGLTPANNIWCHITGTDLIRSDEGTVYVLEDNLRSPSGVSYVLENRDIMKRVMPGVFDSMRVAPVDDYPNRLLETLQSLSHGFNPTIAILTPGVYNSAYFEHSFLAQQMGVELVEGRDLQVKKDFVYMRTTKGFVKVDVIYRRIDDDFLDPKVFRKDSIIGIPGLMKAFKKGNIAIANAPGSGIADDKLVYTYVPDMIKFYLAQDPILPNVPTYRCYIEGEKNYVLANLKKLVVKTTGGAGGYGMLIGPQASETEINTFREKIKDNPRNYIAQPTISLSRVPTIVGNGFEGRHVDLRPYILFGNEIYVLPGGLTRVALKKGSLVVNSSQGGGSKDTWVLC